MSERPTDSYPPRRPLSWPTVVLNLGMAVCGVVAWALGAPDLVVGALLGAAGVAGTLNGWRR